MECWLFSQYLAASKRCEKTADRKIYKLFEIITGRTFMDSFLADRMDLIVGLKRVLGQLPLMWRDALESNVRNMLDSTPARDMGFYQYLELNYNQDDAKLLALDGYEDEEEFPIEEFEKLPPEFTETDLYL